MKRTLSLLFALLFVLLTVFSACTTEKTTGTNPLPPSLPAEKPSLTVPDVSTGDTTPVLKPTLPDTSSGILPPSPSKPDDNTNEDDDKKTTLTKEQLLILLQHLKDNQVEGDAISKEEQKKIEEQIKEALAANKDPISDKDVYNVLLIGYDYKSESGAKNSDTMILLSINFKAKTLTMTSFMRDSYVQIPGVGYNRLNVAYAVNGYPLLKTTIQNNFGITIDNYVALDFHSFIDFYDAIGGMDVNILANQVKLLNERIPIYYALYAPKGYNVKTEPLKEGINHLDGVQLLTYVRNRSTGGDSDFGRTERQRALISNTVKKLSTLSVNELYDLMELMLPKVTTDIPAAECTALLMKMITRNVFSYKHQGMQIPQSGTWWEKIIILAGTKQQVLAMDYLENTKRFKKLVYGY